MSRPSPVGSRGPRVLCLFSLPAHDFGFPRRLSAQAEQRRVLGAVEASEHRPGRRCRRQKETLAPEFSHAAGMNKKKYKGPLSYTIYTNEVQMDQRLKYRT